MKKHIITISGLPGSGKSSTADKVAKELDYRRFSSGDFMRNIAVARGISLNELSALAEKDQSIDTSIDDENKKVAHMENVVVDSRLAFYFIPDAFKVFLDLPREVAKNRVLNSLKVNQFRQQSEGEAKNVDEVYRKITERLESEKKRYIEFYGIDHTNKSNFDLVIDTNKNNLEQVVDIILREYKKWLKN